MGFWGTFLFSGGRWQQLEVDDPIDLAGDPSIVEPWLLVEIHDSDITTLTYRPSGPGTGVAYLGFTPRDYFESPDASRPIDVIRESAGLAAWWGSLRADADEVARSAKATEFREFLASDDSLNQAPEADAEQDDSDTFVEIKTERFIRSLGLPVPDELAG